MKLNLGRASGKRVGRDKAPIVRAKAWRKATAKSSSAHLIPPYLALHLFRSRVVSKTALQDQLVRCQFRAAATHDIGDVYQRFLSTKWTFWLYHVKPVTIYISILIHNTLYTPIWQGEQADEPQQQDQSIRSKYHLNVNAARYDRASH